MKKLLAVLLTVAMTLSLLIVPVTVSAETTNATVGYQAVTGTQKAGTTDWASVTLEENGVYYVATADDMVALAVAVNNGSAKGKNITVYVTADTLDMGSVTFAGIGTAANPFDGAFDGQGVTVQNLAMNFTETADLGMFGVIDGATVKNIVLDSTCTVQVTRRSATLGDGALVGRIEETGVVENVLVKTVITLGTNEEALGGIIGIVAAEDAQNGGVQIRNCTFQGTFSRNNKNLNQSGGILGVAKAGYVKLYSCVNKSDLDCGWGYDIGGIVGAGNSGSHIVVDTCVNEGKITAKEKSGGIAGEVNDIEITNSANAGAIVGRDNTAVGNIGGLVGISKGNSSISNSVNSGTVDGAKGNVGGFVGNASGALTLTGCTNKAAVKATAWADPCSCGGFVGYSAGTTTIVSSVNDANILTAGSAAAGIIGYSNGTLTVTDCVNNGTINPEFKGQPNIAGIAGTVAGTKATISGCVNNGDVKALNKNGGIVGEASAATLTVENCLNFGAITAKGTPSDGVGQAFNSAGGILGRVNTNATVSNCTNYGAVTNTGNGFAGGLIGGVDSERTVTLTCSVNKGTQSHADTDNGGSDWLQGNLAAANHGTITYGTDSYDATGVAAHFAGYQLGTYTKDGATGNKIRLVGTIGSDYADYDEVGFIVKITRTSDGETKHINHYCEAIYASLLGENDSTIDASKYREGGYMFALALYGISAGEYTFEVQTVSVKMGQTEYVVGETVSFTCTVPEA